ncbi:unnamed protein product, partial [Musa acuminata subsp. burmannicoides]
PKYHWGHPLVNQTPVIHLYSLASDEGLDGKSFCHMHMIPSVNQIDFAEDFQSFSHLRRNRK